MLFITLCIDLVFLILLKLDLTNRVVAEDKVDPLRQQSELSEAWSSLLPDFPKENIFVLPSIEHAVRVARDFQNNDEQRRTGPSGLVPVDVLVAGSLHLVGGVIEVAGLSETAL